MNRTEVAAGLLVLVVMATVAGGLGHLAVTIDGQPNGNDSGAAASAAEPTSIGEVHETGTTGKNVSVGVLDVTGYDLEHKFLEERIAGARGFGDDARPVDAGDSHGTSTAVTIAQIAPDADLYLATFEGSDEYEDALEWLIERDVDVIVVPVADAGTFGDGTSQLARATTDATERGAVIVAPAGNLGSGHWLGKYAPNADGVHVFGEGPLNGVTGPASRAEFHLAWDDPSEDYRLELYRLSDGGADLVAQSVPRDREDVRSEHLTVRLDDEDYAITVRGPKRATGTRIRVASSTHSLADARPAGSVAAPADAPGAISVGALDSESDAIEPYSSRGPTADGRLGVHVVARSSQPVAGTPPFEGTSAAAAYAGGVAALVVDAAPELDPREVRWTVASTADPIDGVDAQSGHGLVDPLAAVLAANPDLEEG